MGWRLRDTRLRVHCKTGGWGWWCQLWIVSFLSPRVQKGARVLWSPEKAVVEMLPSWKRLTLLPPGKSGPGTKLSLASRGFHSQAWHQVEQDSMLISFPSSLGCHVETHSHASWILVQVRGFLLRVKSKKRGAFWCYSWFTVEDENGVGLRGGEESLTWEWACPKTPGPGFHSW